MADETDLRADVNRAARAKALLEDEMLSEAFAELEQEYLKHMLATSVSDDKAREKLFLAMRIVPAVRRNLEVMLMDGAVSAKQLANLEADQARAKQRR